MHCNSSHEGALSPYLVVINLSVLPWRNKSLRKMTHFLLSTIQKIYMELVCKFLKFTQAKCWTYLIKKYSNSGNWQQTNLHTTFFVQTIFYGWWRWDYVVEAWFKNLDWWPGSFRPKTNWDWIGSDNPSVDHSVRHWYRLLKI